MTKPTKEQILARIEEVKKNDFMGFETFDLVEALDFEDARAFLKEEVSAAEWDARKEKGENPETTIREYLPFAWEKANNCRGLSADRSVSHMAAWLFLAGHGTLVEPMRDLYQYYGKPCLVVVSELVGFPWQDYDNKRWVNDEHGLDLLDADGLHTEIAKALAVLTAYKS